MSYTVSITTPSAGSVPLVNGEVYVEVDVSGDTAIESVWAEAYEDGQQPPQDPQFQLDLKDGTGSPDGCSGTYCGYIPGFSDEFDIESDAYFDGADPMDPPICSPMASDGPYTPTTSVAAAKKVAQVAPAHGSTDLYEFCQQLGISVGQYYRWIKPRCTRSPGGRRYHARRAKNS